MLNSDKMLINRVYMNMKLTRALDAFHLLAPSDDNKVRFMILDDSPFPLFLAHGNVLGIKRKAHYPDTILKLKPLLRVFGHSRSLSLTHSLDQLQNGIWYNCLKILHSFFCKYKSLPLSALCYDKSRGACSASFRNTHYGFIFNLLGNQGLGKIIFNYWCTSRCPC